MIPQSWPGGCPIDESASNPIAPAKPSAARCEGQGGEKGMTKTSETILFLTRMVCGESAQPVWRDRVCATVRGVGSRIPWAAPRRCGSGLAATPPTSRARLFPFLLRWRRRQSSPRVTVVMRPEPVRGPHRPASPHKALPAARKDCWPTPPAVLPSSEFSGGRWPSCAFTR
jgi:hypothetical protein